MDDSELPFKVLSPTKVWLSATARDMCKAHDMSEMEMCKHLLAQARLRELGLEDYP
jgi:hypothetical protein